MRTPDKPPVFVGVNGTAAGLAAVRFAAREAVARGRSLRVVHVFAWPGSPDYGAGPDYATARQDAGRIVAEAVATASRSTPGVRVDGELVDGLPIRVLLQLSRRAEVLVLGDDDLATVARLPVDSVLLQTVSRAWCPVVVARGLRPPAGSALVGVDGSGSSLRALRYAAGESRRRGIPIEVAHVVEEPGAAAEAAGRRLIEAAVAAVPELSAPRTRLLIGDPARALIRASRHARVTVVGARGADGSVLLGDVAQRLLRRCASPTVFVHGKSAPHHRSTGTVPSAGAVTG